MLAVRILPSGCWWDEKFSVVWSRLAQQEKCRMPCIRGVSAPFFLVPVLPFPTFRVVSSTVEHVQ